MKLVLYLIGRLIIICFALFIALFAGSFFIGFGLANGLLTEYFGPEGHAQLSNTQTGNLIIAAGTLVLGLVASFQLAGIALLPVTIAIAITELMKWQSLTVQLVLGGLCALFTLFSVLALPVDQLPSNGTVIVSLAAGFVSAFFYWLIAGRNAGEWLAALGEEDAHRES